MLAVVELMLAVLTPLGAEVVGLGPKWSVVEADQGEKWPKPERESDPTGSGPHKHPKRGRGPLPIFSLD